MASRHHCGRRYGWCREATRPGSLGMRSSTRDFVTMQAKISFRKGLLALMAKLDRGTEAWRVVDNGRNCVHQNFMLRYEPFTRFCRKELSAPREAAAPSPSVHDKEGGDAVQCNADWPQITRQLVSNAHTLELLSTTSTYRDGSLRLRLLNCDIKKAATRKYRWLMRLSSPIPATVYAPATTPTRLSRPFRLLGEA